MSRCDDRVVKVTEDYSDAKVAERARRAQTNGGCRNLMRVYNVWRLPSNYSLYCIVAERLSDFGCSSSPHIEIEEGC